MKIKFIKPHYKYSYFPGDEGEIESKEAQELVSSGFAVMIEPEEKPEKPAKSKQK